MIIRTFGLALLLSCCSTVFAEPLYKWIEADGSITFSPDKPENGIDFQLVNATEGVASSTGAIRDSQFNNGALATEATTRSQQISIDATGQVLPVASTYTSSIRLNSNSITIDGAGSNAGQNASITSSVNQSNRQVVQSTAAQSSAVEKQNRCEDLRKRVVSLERRLQSNLTPADMDNTVVHMSRYQRSYNQFCVQ
jgi:hypothetical protein